MLGAGSSARVWSSALRQRVVAVRDRAFEGFRGAVTRSQKYRAAWRYIRLRDACEFQWSESAAIFQAYFLQVVDYLRETTFGPGWGLMTIAEYDAQWRFTKAEEEELWSIGGGGSFMLRFRV